MEYVGIDVHQPESQVCIVDEDGRVLLERRVRTRGERFAALLEGRGRMRVVLEASTESEWVAQALEAVGHEVIVADPNFAPMCRTRCYRHPRASRTTPSSMMPIGSRPPRPSSRRTASR